MSYVYIVSVSLFIGMLYYATHIYICKHDFLKNFSFEFIKRESLNSFEKNPTELHTGYDDFDSLVYISCDLDAIKIVLEDEEIRKIIIEIIREINIYGIYIKNGKIKLRVIKTSHLEDELINSLEVKLNSQVVKLKNKLTHVLSIVNESDLKRSNTVGSNINRVIKIFWGFLIVASSLSLNILVEGFGSYIYLSFFSLPQIFCTFLIFFIPIGFLMWTNSRLTLRTHLIFNNIRFVLLPACIMSSILFLYITNISWDNKKIITTEEEIKIKSWSGGKSINYDLYIIDPENQLLKKYFPRAINYQTYFDLKSKNKAKFNLGKGYWGQPYLYISD